MPVRPRRTRRHKTALTLDRCMLLQLGPLGPYADLDLPALERVFREHRRWFSANSWGARVFEAGDDLDLVDGDLGLDDADDPGCSPLPPGVVAA